MGWTAERRAEHQLGGVEIKQRGGFVYLGGIFTEDGRSEVSLGTSGSECMEEGSGGGM